MRRVKLCCIILGIVLFFSLGSLWVLDYECGKLLNQISVIEELQTQEKTAQALEETDELCRMWQHSYKILSVMVRSDKLSEVNAILARLRPLMEKDNDELGAELRSAIYQLGLLCETEYPYLHNIF